MKPSVLLLAMLAACHPHHDDPAPPAPGRDVLPDPNAATPVKISGSTCRAFAPSAPSTGSVVLKPIFSGLQVASPLAMAQPPGDNSRWFLIEQSGRVFLFPNKATISAAEQRLVLDLGPSIYAKNEAGLLGMAIDPSFGGNGAVYLSYTTPASSQPDSTAVTSTVRRFVWSGQALVPDTVVLTQPNSFDFHLGGNMAFGPDGMLYIGMGFCDTANDPAGFAQNPQTWRGKMLRIDVHTSDGSPYRVPANNPFAAGGALPEIYATGLRNPWRWSIDASTGDIWLGDVGQDAWEEVDRIESGKNYGWPVYEAAAVNPKGPGMAPGTQYTPPVYAYGHSTGFCIVGGYVYRGRALPALTGKYVFGDCLAGKIWTLERDAAGNATVNKLVDTAGGTLSFAQDNDGEIYVLSRGGGIARLEPAATSSADTVPTQLSKTGCTRADDVQRPAEGMLAYNVRVPLWSDGADKARYLSLPQGGKLHLDADGSVEFPGDTVLVKRFERAGAAVETRLLMRYADGTWGGFSYAWDASGRDATLVGEAGSVVTLADGTTWNYPSRSDCLSCHGSAAHVALGWQVAQLNTDVPVAGGTRRNQLETLAALGVFAGALPGPAASLPRLPDVNDAAVPLHDRARAYLHVNCAMCHSPGGSGLGGLDLRQTTADADLGVCLKAPTYGSFGLTNAALLVPGDASRSLMSYRMHTTSPARMPFIGSRRVDSEGTALIDGWINGLQSCPQ